MNKTFTLVCCLLFSFNALATLKAQIIVLKGKVTKLEPGKHQAKPVKRGDWLIEDTSIVTQAKSFAKLRFSDGSTMNVGSKSMVVINKIPENKPNMINLLKGVIKAEVKKEKKKSRNKMLIRTRSAVMGVRGTKFQTTYNHANKRTALVTVEGKVAMVRNIQSDKAQAVKESPAKRVDKLDSILENADNAVEVEAGQYSGVAESIEKPSAPVKIAPAQYDALAKAMNSKKTAKDVMKVSEDISQQTVGPKAGGMIDFETGLYIEPEANAEFDKETGTFKAKAVGTVDEKTGDYIPPKGIKLDAKKGFVIDEKAVATLADNSEKEEIQKKLSELNQSVKEQVTTIEEKEKEVAKKPKKKSKPWVKNHILSFNFMPYAERLKLENKETGRKDDFESDRSHFAFFEWKQVWNDKWSTRLRLGGHTYEVDDSNLRIITFQEDDERDRNNGDFESLGIAYKLNKKMEILFDLVSWEQTYVVEETEQEIAGEKITRRSLQTLDLGFSYYHNPLTFFVATGHFLLDGDSPGEYGQERDGATYGFTLEANSLYAINKKYALQYGLFHRRLFINNIDYEFERIATGLNLELIWDI